jgi:hypothetical protein
MKINPIYVIFPLAMLSMLVGVYAGWLRLGWDFVIFEPAATAQHGALMVGSFLGTLISAERVAVLKNKWWWLVPLCFVSSFPLMMHVSAKAGYAALVVGSTGYGLISFRFYAQHRFVGNALMGIGAAFQWLGHVILLLTYSYPMAFAGWLAFFVFTIVGERLNLTRFLPVTARHRTELWGWLLLFVASLFLYHRGYGIVLTVSLVGIGQWLIRNDIARHNIRKTGSYRFLGIALLLGYGWLMLTGFVAVTNAGSPWLYDAVVHAFFVGFVLTMIMAHAPIIFPSLLGLNVKPYHPLLYGWLGILQVSLGSRILADLWQWPQVRQWSGLANGLAFVGYLLTVIVLVISQKIMRKKHSSSVNSRPQRIIA